MFLFSLIKAVFKIIFKNYSLIKMLTNKLSINQSIYQSINLSIYQSINQSIYLSLYEVVNIILKVNVNSFSMINFEFYSYSHIVDKCILFSN